MKGGAIFCGLLRISELIKNFSYLIIFSNLNFVAGKRPSLSDRYPTSPSGSSEGSNPNSDQSDQDLNLIEDNLDIISIITDGMDH